MKQFTILFFIFCTVGNVLGFEMPKGWQAAKKTKNLCAKKGQDVFLVQSDFDGDGQQDTARLLAKEIGEGIGLFIESSALKKTFLIAETKDKDGLHSLGIRFLPPGEYKTMCGKKHRKCGKGEKPVLALKNNAMSFFTCERAASIIYWDKSDEAFIQVAVSN